MLGESLRSVLGLDADGAHRHWHRTVALGPRQLHAHRLHRNFTLPGLARATNGPALGWERRRSLGIGGWRGFLDGVDGQIDFHRLVVDNSVWSGDNFFGDFSGSFGGKKVEMVVVVTAAVHCCVIVASSLSLLSSSASSSVDGRSSKKPLSDGVASAVKGPATSSPSSSSP